MPRASAGTAHEPDADPAVRPLLPLWLRLPLYLGCQAVFFLLAAAAQDLALSVQLLAEDVPSGRLPRDPGFLVIQEGIWAALSVPLTLAVWRWVDRRPIRSSA